MFNNLKLFHKIVILIGIFLLGYMVYGAWSFKTLNELKVNGPVYHQIIKAKDLVADVLPPPSYIVESYLITLQLANESDITEQNRLIVRLKTLKSDYEQQHEYWASESLDNELGEAFLKQSYIPAVEFYRIAFDNLIPAIQKNDSNKVKVSMIRIKYFYEAHRKAIDKVIILAKKRTTINEVLAKEQIRSSNIFLLIVFLLSIITGVSVALMVLHSINKSLGAEPFALSAASKRIAEGDLDSQILFSENDNSSVIYQIDKMRIQLKERFALEQEKTKAELRVAKAEKEILIAEEHSLREKEKVEIYLSMARAAHHILNNLLNQFQLFKLEAEKCNDFGRDVIQSFNDSTSEANNLLDKLSNIPQITTERINESVRPK
jgi:methyl-accepting chemotaxis protein